MVCERLREEHVGLRKPCLSCSADSTSGIPATISLMSFSNLCSRPTSAMIGGARARASPFVNYLSRGRSVHVHVHVHLPSRQDADEAEAASIPTRSFPQVAYISYPPGAMNSCVARFPFTRSLSPHSLSVPIVETQKCAHAHRLLPTRLTEHHAQTASRIRARLPCAPALAPPTRNSGRARSKSPDVRLPPLMEAHARHADCLTSAAH